MTERQKVSLATLASICLHLLVLGLIMVWASFMPKADLVRPEEPKPLEVTLVPKPSPTPPLPETAATPTPTPTPSLLAQTTPTPNPAKANVLKKTIRTVLDLTGLNSTEKAPKHALFESDINSQAASELPARGNLPLPTQEGSKRLRDKGFLDFASTDVLLGQVRPETSEIFVKKEEEMPPEASEPEAKLPSETISDMPHPMPVATPPPPLSGFALGRPTPVPPKATPTPVPKTSVTVAPPPPKSMPAPRLKMPPPGYQQLREKTQIDGGITNRGKSGVAAVGTPLGRYNKAVADAIGSRWYFYVHQRKDLVDAGEARIHFYVNANGQVENVRILSNTANDTFAGVGIKAVTEAKIPPIPTDVLETISGGHIEITYRFVGYDE